MTRFKKLAQALVSGYFALLVSVAYSMASIPMALRYLGGKEFGIWVLVAQVVAYLALIELGISAAVYRQLIEHKDNRPNDRYGAIFVTSLLVFASQGILLAISGALLGPSLAQLLKIPHESSAQFCHVLTLLSAVLGADFVLRTFQLPLHAHQRFDICNIASSVGTVFAFFAFWAGLHWGLGIYSFVVATGTITVLSSLLAGISAWRLRLIPRRSEWSMPSGALVRSCFAYGSRVFALNIGWQLVSASQVILASRLISVEAAAIWSIASKPFTLAQQLVWKLFDFAAPSLAEMQVREEVQLRTRYRDILSVTIWAAMAAATITAAVNAPFLQVWTSNRVSWQFINDLGMGAIVVLTCIARCQIGFLGMMMKINGLGVIYFIEGTVFCLLSIIMVPKFGLPALILSAILCTILCSLQFGYSRVAQFFGIRPRELVIKWTFPPILCLIPASVVAIGIAISTRYLESHVQLALIGTATVALSLSSWYFFAKPDSLRRELIERVDRLIRRLVKARRRQVLEE